MMKRIISNLCEKIDVISSDPVVIFKHKYLISLIISMIIGVLYIFGIVSFETTILPEIITFLSIMLAVIGMVLSVTVAIRDGETYKTIKAYNRKIISNFYKTIKGSVLYGISVILLCILILILDIETIFSVRIVVTIFGVFLFSMTVINSITSFLVAFTIMNLDD